MGVLWGYGAREELEGVVGCFINMLVLRARVERDAPPRAQRAT